MIGLSLLILLLPSLDRPPARPTSEKLERLAREAESYGAEVAMVVRSIQRGDFLIRKNPNLALSAASNTKLI